MDAQPPRRRFSRRTLLRLAGAGVFAGLAAEGVRVFALNNTHTVIPGRVYRTAQLSPEELRQFIAEKKIRTVINLRGSCPNTTWYLGEARTTHAAGICQEDLALSAKRLPAPAEIRRLIEVLDHTEYPVVVHCQRGADRTGLVSTAAVLLLTDTPLNVALRQLWPRYGHIRGGRTVIIDQFFEFYAGWLAATGQTHTPDRFRDWALNHYCPGPYRAELTLRSSPEVPTGVGFTLTIRAKNTAVEPWTFTPGGSGGIVLRYGLFTPQGAIVYKGTAGLLTATVRPGEHIDLTAGFPPVAQPGRYPAHADLLDSQPIDILDADFVQYGSEPLVFDVVVK